MAYTTWLSPTVVADCGAVDSPWEEGPFPSLRLLLDGLQNCAYCISARVDKAVILCLLSMIQYLLSVVQNIFFCCYCLQVVWNTNCVTLWIPSCADTRREPLRKPRDKASLFLSSKKHFWQIFLIFQNCRSCHSTSIRFSVQSGWPFPTLCLCGSLWFWYQPSLWLNYSLLSNCTAHHYIYIFFNM